VPRRVQQGSQAQVPAALRFRGKGAVAKSYGVYRNQDGFSERALFVLDDKGIIRWSHASPIGVNPAPTASFDLPQGVPRLSRDGIALAHSARHDGLWNCGFFAMKALRQEGGISGAHR
jgi:hypothetical protein